MGHDVVCSVSWRFDRATWVVVGLLIDEAPPLVPFFWLENKSGMDVADLRVQRGAKLVMRLPVVFQNMTSLVQNCLACWFYFSLWWVCLSMCKRQ